ncbi:MAG: fibronectin type III domain-containing protein [Chlorobi bacterium OLB4]|jgi:hypothetical protein|nr:MAG: fibronectin type III domain-containing protein [Chlorobi bacterium OLB4]MBW7855313.1 hypothetical protein [Ignavibacteria bacterium]
MSLISANTGKYLSPNDDINNVFTNIGNISLTVTNYGTIGNGFVNFPSQPSCQYPINSGIEHLFLGGLWVGGVKNGQTYVTTAAVDVTTGNRNVGFEFTNAPGSGILHRSNLQTSPFFRPDAISAQDFVTDFFDTNLTVNGTVIQEHEPLGIKVLLETYAYDLNFANSFVILNYRIVNIGYKGNTDPIDSIYIGLWADAVVRNTNITPPGGTSFFNKGANGFIDTLRMAYEYDYSGDPGFTDSYLGQALLGVSPRPDNELVNNRTHYTIWQFRNSTDPVYFSPTVDNDVTLRGGRYQKLQGYLTINPPTMIDTVRINQLRHSPSNRSTLLSYGPMANSDGQRLQLNYANDTINIVYAIVCAKKKGTDPQTLDTDFQKEDLYVNLGWAQRSYDNGYKLPSPPDAPITRAEIEDKKVTLWWSKNSEKSVDPISGLEDFEGYKIYRTKPQAQLELNTDLEQQLDIIADFDSINNIGNNTGFGFIKLSEPMMFDGDTNKYWYKFEFPNQLNGFMYVYTVTAYDKGDEEQGLGPLESSKLGNSKRIVVGTPANNNADAEVGVYPNPYYGNAIWDGTGNKREVLRKIYFFNLPSNCEISIWTLSGDLVDRFEHNAETYNASDLEWFNTYSDGTQKFAGGEHAWDLISKDEQAVASGLYFFTVKDHKSGEIKRGKFLIVK